MMFLLKRSWPLAFALCVAPGTALAQQSPPSPDVSAGGLAPPPAVEPAEPQPATTPSATEQELSRADQEDSGRGLEFVWLNAEAGVQHLGLNTFHANNLVDANIVKTSQSGLLLGAGAGVRLIFLTLGARFRLGNFSAWQLWTLDLEGGMRIPLGSLEPYFTFAGGYASMGKFETSDILNTSGLNVRGFNLRGSLGLDYYLAKSLSIGANASGDFLFLSRPKTTATTTSTDPQAMAAAKVYAQDGSSIGGSVTFTAVVGLHF
ncbi:MAG: hypothetical protein QM756_41395 [Polyangiaceae bacterium]